MEFIKKYQIQLTFLLTALFFIPLNTYFNNILEVNCEIEIIRDILIAFIGLGILFFVLNKFLKEKGLEIFNIILFFITVQLFIQGNFINYNLGVLNGANVNWAKYNLAILLESVFWIVLFVLFIKYRSKLLKLSSKICLFIIIFYLLQSAYSLHSLMKNKMIPSKRAAVQKYREQMATTNAYTFSKKDNVLILVIDAMPSDLFDDVLKSQDGDEIRKDFKDFTYYPKAMGRFPTTVMSVPFIQSGVPYDNTIPMDEFNKNNQKYFIQNKLNEYEYHDNLYPYFYNGKLSYYYTVAIRHFPLLTKMFMDKKFNYFNLNCSRKEVQYYNNLREKIKFTDKPVYKYLHIIGVHPGARMNKDNTYNQKASLEDTAVGNLRIMNYIFEKLKEQNVYDNSMIFVTADHGLAPSNIRKKYSRPMFLFKNYNTTQDNMKISDDFVSLGDIPNTIFDEHKQPLNPYGLSILKEIPKNRVLEICNYLWSEQIIKDSLSKNQLPPLTCVNFIDGNMINYTKEDAILKNKKTEFGDDIEKILYAEHYIDRNLHCIILGENSYIKFYIDKNNYPQQDIKVTLSSIWKEATVKRIIIQDDKTKENIFEYIYKKNKPVEISFDVPKTAIKDDGEVKLNIIIDKPNQIEEQWLGIYVGKIGIEIN